MTAPPSGYSVSADGALWCWPWGSRTSPAATVPAVAAGFGVLSMRAILNAVPTANWCAAVCTSAIRPLADMALQFQNRIEGYDCLFVRTRYHTNMAYRSSLPWAKTIIGHCLDHEPTAVQRVALAWATWIRLEQTLWSEIEMKIILLLFIREFGQFSVRWSQHISHISHLYFNSTIKFKKPLGFDRNESTDDWSTSQTLCTRVQPRIAVRVLRLLAEWITRSLSLVRSLCDEGRATASRAPPLFFQRPHLLFTFCVCRMPSHISWQCSVSALEIRDTITFFSLTLSLCASSPKRWSGISESSGEHSRESVAASHIHENRRVCFSDSSEW